MARMAKMDTCPDCGATIAKNLAERVRNGVPGYSCPGTTTQPSRKEFEEDWKKDLENGSADYLEWVLDGAPSA